MRFLSQCIGLPVRDPSGEPIGTIADLIVAIGDRYPPVTGLVLRTDRRNIFLPWRNVRLFDDSGATLAVPTIDIGAFRQRQNEILLKADLLDKQIVDIEGRKVIRVNDVRLDDERNRLRVVAVDVGAAGLLRRLGIEGAFRTIARNVGASVPERYIDWEDVDPLESTIASVRLRVPHAKLAELHPADLASIIEELTPRDRLGVLASLDDEALADVVEEMEPETQVEVLEDLEPARAADILEEMSPDDAADLVADLSDRSRDEILALMEEDEADEVRDLLAFPEDSAGGLMTTEFVAVPAHLTAEQTIARLRELEPDAETIYYVYVTDDDGHLAGVLSLRDLIVARPDAAVADVMIDEPVAVGALEPAESVAETIAHYNLLAVPVVDDEGLLVGIVTVDDALDTVAPAAWRRRLPRVFARAEADDDDAGATPVPPKEAAR
ncbi:MAG TPA: CBS domain-containing protein [Candidatus Limnocylindrales bacterium]|nr:CBS domain-containing protein [Candidatus Limnocylindrales bacterium]